MKATVKCATVTLSVILLASLIANAYLYFSVNNLNNGLQKQVTDLQSQVVNLQNQTNSLQSEKADLESQVENLTVQLDVMQQQLNNSQNIIANLQTQNTNLQNQLNMKGTANLVTNLGISDAHFDNPLPPHDPNYRLFIEGVVFNTGSKTAVNCKLHVTAYQGGTVAIDTDIMLGTISSGSSVHVSSNLSYSGDLLTYWKVTPEWTNSP